MAKRVVAAAAPVTTTSSTAANAPGASFARSRNQCHHHTSAPTAHQTRRLQHRRPSSAATDHHDRASSSASEISRRSRRSRRKPRPTSPYSGRELDRHVGKARGRRRRTAPHVPMPDPYARARRCRSTARRAATPRRCPRPPPTRAATVATMSDVSDIAVEVQRPHQRRPLGGVGEAGGAPTTTARPASGAPIRVKASERASPASSAAMHAGPRRSTRSISPLRPSPRPRRERRGSRRG